MVVLRILHLDSNFKVRSESSHPVESQLPLSTAGLGPYSFARITMEVIANDAGSFVVWTNKGELHAMQGDEHFVTADDNAYAELGFMTLPTKDRLQVWMWTGTNKADQSAYLLESN